MAAGAEGDSHGNGKGAEDWHAGDGISCQLVSLMSLCLYQHKVEEKCFGGFILLSLCCALCSPFFLVCSDYS